MTLIVDIKKSFALSVLEGLEKIGAIDIKNEELAVQAPRAKVYNAARIQMKDFRFNGEEANER